MPCRRLLAAVALFVALGTQAHAQAWPTRPVTMVVPFAPGGVYDTLGRVYAAALSDALGQQIVVENVQIGRAHV
jgi:tripartite-type tricarboxylate transporter receptor subunit TctC